MKAPIPPAPRTAPEPSVAGAAPAQASIFSRVLAAHEETQASIARAMLQRSQDARQAKEAFVAGFRSAAATIAKPLFEAFADEATRAGYSARVDDNLQDEAGGSIVLHINPRKVRTETHANEECALELAALAASFQVSHASRFDMRANDRGHRINPDGARTELGDLDSMRREVLEQELEEFWRLSLESRRAEG